MERIVLQKRKNKSISEIRIKIKFKFRLKLSLLLLDFEFIRILLFGQHLFDQTININSSKRWMKKNSLLFLSVRFITLLHFYFICCVFTIRIRFFCELKNKLNYFQYFIWDRFLIKTWVNFKMKWPHSNTHWSTLESVL